MSGAIAVFAGPSLAATDAAGGQRLHFYGPASTGDVLQVARSGRYSRICLVDGYFDHRPAPWHKELLSVMQCGIELFGAASMGALRAAELDRFGMIGVGSIYRAYRCRLLSGDDEVALIHAPGQLGWAALSVPMIDLRFTLGNLVRARTLEAAIARRAIEVLRDIHYADRDWPMIEAACDAPGLDRSIAGLIQQEFASLKSRDASECVAQALSSCPIERQVPPVPQTCFLRDLQSELAIRPAPRRAS